MFRQGKALVPSFTAFAVTELLRQHFTDYVDPGFTAEMEEVLDQISNGERDWLDFVKAFYRGDAKHTGLDALIRAKQSEIDYPLIEVGVDPESGHSIRVRIGRYGPFLQRGEGGEGNTASLPDDLAPADLTVEKAVAQLNARRRARGSLARILTTGLAVFVMNGRFGPYVQLGEMSDDKKAAKPKRTSLLSTMTEQSVTLDDALRLLSLPREVGMHPSDGEPIVASLGRFGPYIKHGNEFRSLENEDDSSPCRSTKRWRCWRSRRSRGAGSPQRRRCCASSRPIRRRRPVSASSTAATVRTSPTARPTRRCRRALTPEAVTLEQAAELLAARAGAPKRGRGRVAGRAPAASRKATTTSRSHLWRRPFRAA